MTTLYAPQAPTRSLYLEAEMFSTKRRHPARGWDAPAFNGVKDLPDDSRSRLERVSARAAYQEVLYGRATLVDIRSWGQRQREGEVHPDLAPVVIERHALSGAWTHSTPPACRSPISACGSSCSARRATRHPWPQTCC